MSLSTLLGRSGFARLSLIAGFAMLACGQSSAQSLPTGAGVIEASIGPEGRPMKVWYYRPAGLSADDPVLFVLHGVLRDANVYRDAWVRHAQDYRFLLLAPEFSKDLFPTTESYNFGNMVSSSGAALPRALSSFAVIDRAFAEIRPMTPIKRTKYAIYGHSAGAQFVHRFMTLWAADQVESAVSANAGAYMLPTTAERYPYGLGGLDLSGVDLKAVFARPHALLLGEADIDPNHRFLPRAPAAARQGEFRLARGKFYYETAKAAAEQAGAPFAWTLRTVPGVGHDNARMASAAAAQLFKKPGAE